MAFLALNITDKKYCYDEIKLETTKTQLTKDLNTNTKGHVKSKRNIKRIRLDCAFVNYLIRELMISEFYRSNFIFQWTDNSHNSLNIVLKSTKYDLIDYKWNDRVFVMARERCELDHALSWLSTLGGAFSALGNYFPSCADTAGKISIHQLKLALRMGDPNIAARCRLYLSLSLIQTKKFKYARKIVYNEYQKAKNATIVDFRLLNMCRGIWSKLQYEHQLFKIRPQTVLSRKMNKIVI